MSGLNFKTPDLENGVTHWFRVQMSDRVVTGNQVPGNSDILVPWCIRADGKRVCLECHAAGGRLVHTVAGCRNDSADTAAATTDHGVTNPVGGSSGVDKTY